MFQPASATTTLLQIMEIIQKEHKITAEQESVINELLTKGADPTVGTASCKNTILILAILYGNEKFAMEVINLIKSLPALNQADQFGFALNTPLLIAIKRGMYDAATLLVERGVNLDYASDSGFTALHFASGLLGIEKDVNKEMKLIALMHKMLEHGADPRKLNCFNSTALDLLKDCPSPMDFQMYQESEPYRIARVLNISPAISKSWCQLKNVGLLDQMKRAEFKKINDLYKRYNEFSIKMKERKSDSEINSIHAEYQAELDAFDMAFNKKKYTVRMIKRLHLYGAQSPGDVHKLLEQGIFESPYIRSSNSIDMDDFMTIIDDTHWHRFDTKMDTLRNHLIWSRRGFYQKYASEIQELEEHMSKKIEELNMLSPSHGIQQIR